jgi:hypothetical protein
MLSSRHDGLVHNAFLAKTPGRSVLKGRTGLRENLIHHGPMTGNAKGKKQHTPFHPRTLREFNICCIWPKLNIIPEPQRAFKQDHESKSSIFLDPPAFEVHHSLVTPLPSSTRKHSRVPRSASRSFETPVTRGNPYDVSDISIDVADVMPVAGAANQSSVIEEDYDEIEYMPPTAIGTTLSSLALVLQ